MPRSSRPRPGLATQSPNPSRRRFLRTVGLAGLSSGLAPVAMSLAQSAPPPGGPAPTPATPPAAGTTPAVGATPEPPGEDARSLAEIIRRRYGKNLSPDQIDSIARDFDGDIKAGKRLHDVKLANGDEPDATFHA